MEQFTQYFHLPITDPVMVFAIVLFVIFLAPRLLQRFKVPGIIGMILSGALLGPNGFHVLEKSYAIELFGTVGLLYIMFQAGLEVDLNEFKKTRKKGMVFGLLSFAIPQVFGAIGVWYLLDLSWPSALLLASMFASHTLVAYSIVSRLDLVRNEVVTVTLGGTLVVNILALLVLAVIASSVEGDLGAGFWLGLLVSLSIFVYVVVEIGPRVVRWFFRNVESEGASQYIFVLSFVFAASFGAKLAGVEPIIGAFLAGLAINRLVPGTSPLMNRIDFVGSALFIPFFLIHVGMLSDFSIFLKGKTALIAVGVIAALSISLKWLPAYLTARIYGYRKEEQGVMFGLSVAQAASTLAAALVGYELGFINDDVLNGIIIMILVTCMVSSFVVESAGRKLAVLQADEVPEEELAEERLLVPVANPANIMPLVDLAVMITPPGSRQPVYPLSVINDDASASSRILETKKQLEKAVRYAAATDTLLEPITRIDVSPGSGIVRTIKEMMITRVIVGWHGDYHPKDHLFGTVLDYILLNCFREVLVTRLLIPLNTLEKIFVIVPENAELELHFPHWLKTLKTLANQTTGTLHFAGPADTIARITELAQHDKPVVEVHTQVFSDWEDILILGREVGPDDLFVIVQARERTISYQSWMKRLPRYLSRHFSEVSFLLIYPDQEH
ncbi:cation:proton antiporter [Phaeodactylibacter xiamenensis]|uniref:cation:proton antiporter n=1 Tax=Phaeodactylibacter xiamenensis TaxID=1524460 RepID=UPI0024A8648D|nr:cation:proton antiporter [Phaeodactylibacter xiamenensis]